MRKSNVNWMRKEDTDKLLAAIEVLEEISAYTNNVAAGILAEWLKEIEEHFTFGSEVMKYTEEIDEVPGAKEALDLAYMIMQNPGAYERQNGLYKI